ncbi:MAG: GNAT family N-acetyltransferase [Candidatus Dormibacteraeota bacterium]|nr:GNAT family N-acetyltransferase [Candidatus Dormibacteraeota bacterium]
MLRSAVPADVPVILELVKELARYEREPEAVRVTEPALLEAIFGPEPVASVELAVHEGSEGPETAGMALWYRSYSTWTGPGIYLEDLFVREQYRKLGYGKALLRRLAQIAVERGYARFEWSVLDWNQPSIDFYLAMGARAMDDWTRYRLEGAALRALGGAA